MRKYLRFKTAICLFFCLAAAFTLNAQYQYYFGNLHAHSKHSDGCKEAAATGKSTPADCDQYASKSDPFYFLGISKHNYNQAGIEDRYIRLPGMVKITFRVTENCFLESKT